MRRRENGRRRADMDDLVSAAARGRNALLASAA